MRRRGGQVGLVVMVNAVPSAVPKIRVREIAAIDINGVIDTLSRGFPWRSRRLWTRVLARLARRSTPEGLPKFGYLLESGGVVVGAILLISSRMPNGSVRCNVSSWCVDRSHRTYAGFLAAKALSHKNVTYLNITPAPHTRPIAQAQGYSQYSGGLFIALLQRMPVTGIRARGAELSRIGELQQESQLVLRDVRSRGKTSLRRSGVGRRIGGPRGSPMRWRLGLCW